MGKFITEAKKERLEQDGGKQAPPDAVAKLFISDINQRIALAMAWGYSKEEATHLVTSAFAWWKAAEDQEVPTDWKPAPKKVEAEAEPEAPPLGPPPGV